MRAIPYALTLLVAGAVFLIAFDHASYGLASRNSLAIVAWWSLALLTILGVWSLRLMPRSVGILAILFLGFAAWVAASIAWADSAERAFNEFNRVVLYLGIYLVAAVAATRRSVGRWLDGIAIAIAAVAALSLASRLFPGLTDAERDPVRFLSQPRLGYPVDYWTGLAILIGLSVGPMLRAAVNARRAVTRALAVASLPIMTCVVYLTSSRIGVLVAAVAVVVFFVASRRRWAVAGAIAAGAAGSAAALGLLLSQPDLVDPPLPPDSPEAAPGIAVAILVVCGLTGLVFGVAHRVAPVPPRVGFALRAALWAGALLVVTGAALAADPVDRFESFKTVTPPAERSTVQEHLFSSTSSGRWQLWRAAIEEWKTEPITGRGAGSFEAWWSQHGTIAAFARDAHSLFAEVLGELGLVGFAIVVALFGYGLVVALMRLRRAANDDDVRAALVAILIPFVLALAGDWMWELTIVSVVGIAALGLATGRATAPERVASEPEPALWPRFAVPLVAVVAIVALALPLLGDLAVRDSQAAVRRGDGAVALDRALDARRLQPWAATPYLQLALVSEELGNLRPARSWIYRAIDRDRRDWRLWLVAARLHTKLGQVRAARRTIARARELNPRSPLFAR